MKTMMIAATFAALLVPTALTSASSGEGEKLDKAAIVESSDTGSPPSIPGFQIPVVAPTTCAAWEQATGGKGPKIVYVGSGEQARTWRCVDEENGIRLISTP